MDMCNYRLALLLKTGKNDNKKIFFSGCEQGGGDFY